MASLESRSGKAKVALHTDQTTEFDIVIAGGSYAGLALARGLVQALGPQVQIAIVDQAGRGSASRADGRAFAIWAGSKIILESLGVWQALAAEAQEVTSIEISDSALGDALRPTRLRYDSHVQGELPAAYIVPAAALGAALAAYYQHFGHTPGKEKQ